MTCPVLARESASTPNPLPAPFDWWVRAIVDALMPSLGSRVPTLDPETMPDHLKRDVGLLDGRDRYRDESY